MGQGRGQATLDVDGEHPNDSWGWRGCWGLVGGGGRRGQVRFLVFFLGVRKSGSSRCWSVPASEELSSSRRRLAPAELALSARSAIASAPFRDGVMVLLGRAEVSLEFTAGADRELGVGPSGVQVTSGSRGEVAGGGGTDPLCAEVAGATNSASACGVRAVRPGNGSDGHGSRRRQSAWGSWPGR